MGVPNDQPCLWSLYYKYSINQEPQYFNIFGCLLVVSGDAQGGKQRKRTVRATHQSLSPQQGTRGQLVINSFPGDFKVSGR